MIHDKGPARGEGGYWGQRVCVIFRLLDHDFFTLLCFRFYLIGIFFLLD